jgi:hypothetical protein
LVTDDISRLSIRYDGAIGINTDNPVEQLTVFTNGSGAGISHRNANGIVLSTHLGATSASYGTRGPHNFRLVTSDVSRLSITYDGKVGVGIDFPLNTFEVNGTMRAKELIIETVNWPDYVFGDQYKLMPLADVESYINTHKHLPNIVSAAEMEANGVYVGDTQKKMMEKIEELTLYIIDLEKRIAALEK